MGQLRTRQLEVERLLLNGVPVPPACFAIIRSAIQIPGSKVRELGLADTACGRHATQDSCTEAAKLLETLEVLDLSNNFFRAQGLGEVARALATLGCPVRKFALRDNAWVVTPNGAEEVIFPEAHPMLDVCEALRLNRQLEELDLSGCQLTQYAAVCLEDAIGMPHERLRVLDVSRNPFGESGLRSFIRHPRAIRKRLALLASCRYGLRTDSSRRARIAKLRILLLTMLQVLILGHFRYGDARPLHSRATPLAPPVQSHNT